MKVLSTLNVTINKKWHYRLCYYRDGCTTGACITAALVVRRHKVADTQICGVTTVGEWKNQNWKKSSILFPSVGYEFHPSQFPPKKVFCIKIEWSKEPLFSPSPEFLWTWASPSGLHFRFMGALHIPSRSSVVIMWFISNVQFWKKRIQFYVGHCCGACFSSFLKLQFGIFFRYSSHVFGLNVTLLFYKHTVFKD